MSLERNRVVITGMGAVSPLGSEIDVIWERLIAGESGIRFLPDNMAQDLPIKIAGIVNSIQEDPIAGFDPDKLISSRDQKRMARFILFALVAADKALAQAKWVAKTEEEKERTATIIASGIGGLKTIEESAIALNNNPQKRLSPFTVPSFLANLAAGQVSIRYGFKGPLGTPVTACAAGIQAVGDAVRMIQNNEVDVAICGGAESCLDSVAINGFHAAKALTASYNNDPTKASRPFDQDRDGFVIAEGAGILVIERLEHALARGAKPIAEIVGYGTTADAYHITAAPEDGNGARRSMANALKMAGITPDMVSYINAHATSTLVGDRGEIIAIKSLFEDHTEVAISSTKSSTGHLLGAAGGLATIFTALTLKNQIAPMSLNCHKLEPLAEHLNIIMGNSREMSIDYALCNGFGFGGVNASLLLKRYQ